MMIRAPSLVGSAISGRSSRSVSHKCRSSSTGAPQPACVVPHSQSASIIDRRAALGLAMGIAFSWQQVAMADEPAAAVVAELKTASNGIQFVDTLLGTGSTPTKGSLIRCHYIGTLFDGGKEFDSSYSRGKPLSFKVGNGEVIKGWDLGILGDGQDIPPMREGGKRKLIIPAALAYGARGAGGVIPPNSILVFNVELMAPRGTGPRQKGAFEKIN
ncbi:MAG: hypothetical protein WDW38_007618 [Sanguina aurantia]